MRTKAETFLALGELETCCTELHDFEVLIPSLSLPSSPCPLALIGFGARRLVSSRHVNHRLTATTLARLTTYIDTGLILIPAAYACRTDGNAHIPLTPYESLQ